MYGFFVFVLLSLTYRVLWKAAVDLVGIDMPDRVADAVSVAVAALLCSWAGYSVFDAFGTDLGSSTMGWVATGAALVTGGTAFDKVTGMFHQGGHTD